MNGRRLYACIGISLGAHGSLYLKSHRYAFLAGEFDDPCEHGKRLMECGDPECCDLYDSIVASYLERLSGAAA